MKKLIISLASVILLALLGLAGLNQIKQNGPRGRVISPTGSKVIVEEMSYYVNGEKIFGKVFKPTDENGNFTDSMGQMPLLIYFHEPLRTEFPETVVKSLVSNHIVGYTCGFRGDGKDILAIVKRMSREKFVQPGMVFIVSDCSRADDIMKAVAKLGHKIQGLVLVEPNLTGQAREIYVRYGKEFLTINESQKGNAVSLIEDYLEERGALK